MTVPDNILNEISETVAEAINQENFISLNEDITDILNDSGLSADDAKSALEKAMITCWMASFPGCLPDCTAVFSMSADPDTIREDILSWLEDMPEFQNNPGDWEEMRNNVEELDVQGDSLSVPNGMTIEIFRSSCADALKDNDCYPEI